MRINGALYSVAIRVPAWVPVDSMKLAINGQLMKPCWLGHYIQVHQPSPSMTIELSYALPETVMQESVGDVTYTMHWRGDEITGISPHDDFYPFYAAAQR